MRFLVVLFKNKVIFLHHDLTCGISLLFFLFLSLFHMGFFKKQEILCGKDRDRDYAIFTVASYSSVL